MIAISLIVRVLLTIAFSIARPRELRCPTEFFVHGVRPSGVTECISTWDPRVDSRHGGHPEPIDVLTLYARIYCSLDEQPLVINARTVACRKRKPWP